MLAEVIIRQHSTVRAAEKLVAEQIARQGGAKRRVPGSRERRGKAGGAAGAELSPRVAAFAKSSAGTFRDARGVAARGEEGRDRDRVLRQRRPAAGAGAVGVGERVGVNPAGYSCAGRRF